MDITRCYLIVSDSDKVLNWCFSMASARKSINEKYDGCRVVRAVCYEDESHSSPWACGHTFTEAIKNLKRGVFDNWSDF